MNFSFDVKQNISLESHLKSLALSILSGKMDVSTEDNPNAIFHQMYALTEQEVFPRLFYIKKLIA